MSRIAYRVNDVVDSVGIGRSTIYRAIKRGELTARKAGGRTLIMSDDLQAWLDALPVLKTSKARNK